MVGYGIKEKTVVAWEVGTTVHFGYYSQDGIRFDPEKKVIDDT